MTKDNKLMIVAAAVALIIIIALLLLTQHSEEPAPVACSKDAKICPDGTTVGRVPPDCEFAPCPSTLPTREELDALDEEECIAMGYDWVGVPGLGARCDIKTSDAGNYCLSNADCEGVCDCGMTPVNFSRDDIQISGLCSEHLYYTEIIDCPCILINRTKNPRNLYPYGCI